MSFVHLQTFTQPTPQKECCKFPKCGIDGGRDNGGKAVLSIIRVECVVYCSKTIHHPPPFIPTLDTAPQWKDYVSQSAFHSSDFSTSTGAPPSGRPCLLMAGPAYCNELAVISPVLLGCTMPCPLSRVFLPSQCTTHAKLFLFLCTVYSVFFSRVMGFCWHRPR